MNTVCKALAVMAFLAGNATAQTITFKNELRGSVVVQTFTVLPRGLKRDASQLLDSRATSTGIASDADKLVIVYDGRSNKELCKARVKASRAPLHFLILQDRLGRFGLVPAKPPVTEP